MYLIAELLDLKRSYSCYSIIMPNLSQTHSLKISSSTNLFIIIYFVNFNMIIMGSTSSSFKLSIVSTEIIAVVIVVGS